MKVIAKVKISRSGWYVLLQFLFIQGDIVQFLFTKGDRQGGEE